MASEAAKSEAPLVETGRPANYFAVDVALRVLLFAASLTALILMVTAKQTELVPVLGLPGLFPNEAKFTDSPAFIYSVAALSVSCLYSIITTLTSLGLISKPVRATKFLLYYVIFDLLLLGILASETGAGAGVAYIGLKGNDHVRWMKICNRYDKFCRHVGSSLALSLFGSVLLVILVILSVVSLHSRVSK